MNKFYKHIVFIWLFIFFIDALWLINIIYHQQIPTKVIETPCFTLTDSEEGKFYQWSSETNHKPFQAGQWRWINQIPFLSGVTPTITKVENKSFRTHYLSHGPPPKASNLILIYDKWSNTHSLDHPLKQKANQQRKTVVFLDQSATMGNPWNNTKLSSHEMSLISLKKQRELHSSPWELIGFAEKPIYYGTWLNNTSFKFQKLLNPKGKTKWTEALQHWKDKKPSPSNIIMVGDGKVNESNLHRLEILFNELKSLDHQITILSPVLQKLPAWETIYHKKLAKSSWIEETDSISQQTLHSSYPTSITWNNVTHSLPGKYHQPILWSNEGPLLISMEWTDSKQWLHLAGTPSIHPTELLNLLKKDLQHPLTLELKKNSLTLDLQNDSPEPLSLRLSNGEKLIWPTQKGIYQLPYQSDDLHLRHPAFGTIRIQNTLSFKQHVFENPKEILTGSQIPQAYIMTCTNGFLAILHLAVLVLTIFKTTYSKQH